MTNSSRLSRQLGDVTWKGKGYTGIVEVDISHSSPNRLYLSVRLCSPEGKDLHPNESQSETNSFELASRCELVILHGAPRGIRKPETGLSKISSGMSMIFGLC
jgi:hypothetical protein